MSILFFVSSIGFLLTVLVTTIGNITNSVLLSKKYVFILVCLIAIGVITLFFSQTLILVAYYSLVMVFLFVRAYVLFIRIREKHIILDTKEKIVFAATVLTILLLYFAPLIDREVWLVLIILLIPGIIAMYQFIFRFPQELYEDFYISKITQERKKKDISVIVFLSHAPIDKYISKRIQTTRYIQISASGGVKELFQMLTSTHNDKKNILITRVDKNLKEIISALQPKLIIQIRQLQETQLVKFSKKIQVKQYYEDDFAKKDLDTFTKRFAK